MCTYVRIFKYDIFQCKMHVNKVWHARAAAGMQLRGCFRAKKAKTRKNYDMKNI